MTPVHIPRTPTLGPQASPFTELSNLAPRIKAGVRVPRPVGPCPVLPGHSTVSQQLRPRAWPHPTQPTNPALCNSERAPFATGSGSNAPRGGTPAPSSCAPLEGAGPTAGSALSLSQEERMSPSGANAPPRRRRPGGLVLGRWPAGRGPWFSPRPRGPQPAPRAYPLGGLREGVKLRLTVPPNLGLSPLPRSKHFICGAS